MTDGKAPALADALRDRYVLERELGRGGMATVHLARDLRHSRLVAIKVLRAEVSSIIGTSRFLREIRLTARLQHANILPLFDSGEADGRLWYGMPFIQGGTLRERLRRDGQIPLEDALEITRCVLAALACAHEHGIVHRDIKPENILLSPSGALVSDFGIAHAISAAGGERLTETGLAIGTAAYMSPEQATADRRLDGRSDIYSLGCVLYEMLAGEPPYTGPTTQAILAKRLTEPIPHLRTVRDVPVAVEAAVTRALARAPADRFPTAEAFAAALQRAETSPDQTTVVSPAWRLASKRLWLAVALGTLAVAGGALAVRGRRPRPLYLPERVVVAPMENQTGDSILDQFTRQLFTSLPDAIAREGIGDPVPAATARDVVGRATGSPGEVADRLARETEAGLELRGVCNRSGPADATCQVDVLRMPAKILRMSISMSGDPVAPALGARLTERVLVALLLQQTYGDQVKWQGEYITPSLAAARRLMANDEGRAGDAARLDTSWAGAAALATEDSNQPAAEALLAQLSRRPALLQGERESVAFHVALRRGNWDQAFELANRRFEVNPVWWRTPLVRLAVLTGRAHRAVEASREPELGSGPPGTGADAGTYHYRGYALHQLGRYGEELQLAREIKRRWPAQEILFRTHEIMALAGLGQMDSLRDRLARWAGTPEQEDWAGTRAVIAGQELIAHGHEREGLELLSQTLALFHRLRESREGGKGTFLSELAVLQATGRLEEARQLAQAALTTSTDVSDSVVCLGALGALAAGQGKRAEAVRYDRMLAGAKQRRDVWPTLAAIITFSRARLTAQLGEKEGAVRLLEQARSGGSDDVAHYNLHRDPTFASLRDYPPFQRFLEPRD